MLVCVIMLGKDLDISDSQFLEALERYLEELLHARIVVRAFEGTRSLPSFVGRAYRLYETYILGHHCIIAAKLGDTGTPADIAKHIDIIRNVTDATVVFATMSITAHNRARLRQRLQILKPCSQDVFPPRCASAPQACLC